MLYITKFSGLFAFIKPWTAVRDEQTFSQQFLTPSIIEGIEKKIFPELLSTPGIHKIKRHRLTYSGISIQQEQTQPRGIKQKPERITKKTMSVVISRERSILNRGVLLNPILFLAFKNKEDAQVAVTQHICLCRNEDVLLPDKEIMEVSEKEFEYPDKGYNGFELIFEHTKESFPVGFNRFNKSQPMYGRLLIVGDNPLQSYGF